MCCEMTSDSGEDSPIPESGCCTRDEEFSWVDKEDIYVMYKSLSELLCCEIWRAAFG